MTSLANKVLAITGAASGIGRATSLECAKRGALLALSDRDETSLCGLLEELKSQGATAITTVVDVTDSDQVDAWIKEAVDHFGRLDGAANIAGVVGLPGGKVFANITEITNEHWSSILDVNLTGLFYCLRAQLRVMQSGGSIVNLASMAGLIGRPGVAAYSSSKHGVIGLTKSAAKEVGERGIRVNALAPGPVDTPMMKQLKADAGTGGRPVLETYKNVPLQKMGTVENMAKTIAFSLSDDAGYTTGATFTVDGGITC
ncbi:hypothetical protein PISL3812_05111 [Talaromyces islandicus]|uniref:3-oxoacyl-[acyl-carrier-protein] reductase FabG n=1 Tax=Talaromyces islandicus TaxID=28573 RepID=A0A0U1LXJ0_TALIS|nr:hypothetical protein PISL3812_05111 [Talaromyces islandicus]